MIKPKAIKTDAEIKAEILLILRDNSDKHNRFIEYSHWNSIADNIVQLIDEIREE